MKATPDVRLVVWAMHLRGEPVRVIGEVCGLGKSRIATLVREGEPSPWPGAAEAGAAEARLRQARGLPAAGADEDDDGDDVDPNAAPIDIIREQLARTRRRIARLPPDSPRLNPAEATALAYSKALRAMEREEAGKETPEQAAERKRREDGEVRREIERYVEGLERLAGEAGVCVTCGGRAVAS